MNVLSPIWLIGLAPWLLLALWMLRGRGALQRVPFLKLWGGPVAMPRSDRRRQFPPIAIVAILIALLLGVIAAARVAIGKRQELHLTVIVDRGSTMSAQDPQPRFAARCDELAKSLEDRWPRSRVTLIAVPGNAQADLSLDEFQRAVHAMPPTAVDTTFQLAQAIPAQHGNVIVISNQAGDPSNDIGVVGLSLATELRRQLMIRLQNQSNQTSANLRITTAEQQIEKTVPLPPAGSVGNVFIDLDRAGDTIQVALLNADANPVNNVARLVRESTRRSPEVQTSISPAVMRVIDVYRSRRALGDKNALPVVGSVADLGASQTGVIVPKAMTLTSVQPIQLATHPITDNVNWKSLPASIQIADSPDGWTPIVSVGPHVCVAINPQHPKQVWVGLDAEAWSTSPNFVIFWTNVLDYAGGGPETWVSHPLSDWTPEWKLAGADGGQPGIYERSDGVKRAFNASELPAKPTIVKDWRTQLDRVKPESAAGEIAPALLLAALGLIAFFACRY